MPVGEPTTPASSALPTTRRKGSTLTVYTGLTDLRKEKYDMRAETRNAEQEGTCIAF
jgi:hypothetical protein